MTGSAGMSHSLWLLCVIVKVNISNEELSSTMWKTMKKTGWDGGGVIELVKHRTGEGLGESGCRTANEHPTSCKSLFSII